MVEITPWKKRKSNQQSKKLRIDNKQQHETEATKIRTDSISKIYLYRILSTWISGLLDGKGSIKLLDTESDGRIDIAGEEEAKLARSTHVANFFSLEDQKFRAFLVLWKSWIKKGIRRSWKLKFEFERSFTTGDQTFIRRGVSRRRLREKTN